MKIVVLGKNYLTTLGVIRSLGAYGFRMDLLFVGGNAQAEIVASSKYIDHVMLVQGRDDSLIINKLIDEYSCRETKTILITTDDYTTKLIDVNRDNLSKIFLLPFIKKEKETNISLLMNKFTQMEIAKKCGMNVAESWTISLNSQIEIPDEIPYPCFYKPLESVLGSKLEIGICQTKQELMNRLEKMKSLNSERTVLVQEYLNITQEYSIGGVCLDETIVIPCVVKKEKIAKHSIGITLMGQMKSLDIVSEMCKKIQVFLRTIGYQGMFDIEIIECNGKMYFGELNFRSSSFVGAITFGGCNLPAIWVEYLTTGRIMNDYEFSYDTLFLNDRVCWDDYIFAHINKREMKKMYKQVDYTLIHSEQDSKPEEMFIHRMSIDKKRRFEIVIKKFIKKAYKKLVAKKVIL